MSIFNQSEAERNAEIDRSKVTAIRRVLERVEGILGSHRMYADAKKSLKIETLSGADYYALQAELNAFLIGSGQESKGFLAEILEVKELEALRSVVSKHSSGTYFSDVALNPSVNEIVLAAKEWIARCVWADLHFPLERAELPAAKKEIGSSPSP